MKLEETFKQVIRHWEQSTWARAGQDQDGGLLGRTRPHLVGEAQGFLQKRCLDGGRQG